jgi:hypothetical protein
MQWSKEQRQQDNDLQRTRLSNTNPTKNRSEFECSGRVSSSCSTNYARPVTLVTHPVIGHE